MGDVSDQGEAMIIYVMTQTAPRGVLCPVSPQQHRRPQRAKGRATPAEWMDAAVEKLLLGSMLG